MKYSSALLNYHLILLSASLVLCGCHSERVTEGEPEVRVMAGADPVSAAEQVSVSEVENLCATAAVLFDMKKRQQWVRIVESFFEIGNSIAQKGRNFWWKLNTDTFEKCFVLQSETEFPEGGHFHCRISGAGLFPAIEIEGIDGKACTGLPAGRYEWVAYTDGFATPLQRFHLSLESHGEEKIVFERTRRLIVSVLDKDSLDSIDDALVTLSSSPLHLDSVQGISDDDGYVTFEILTSQKYYITARASDYLPDKSHLVQFLDYVDEEDPHFSIFLDSGVTLNAQVVTPYGVPEPGSTLHIMIQTLDGGTWDSHRDLPKPVSPLALNLGKGWFPVRPTLHGDESSQFTIGALPAGKYEVYATHPDFAPSEVVRFDSTHRDDLGDIVLRLSTPHRLLARVTNRQGAGVPAEIRWRASGLPHWSDEVWTDARGMVDFEGLPSACEFEVVAENSMKLNVVLDTEKISEYQFEVEDLSSHVILGKVYSPEGPLAKARITVADTKDHTASCSARTEADGHFELAQCTQGGHWLEVRASGLAPTWVYAPEGGRVSVELTEGEELKGEFYYRESGEPASSLVCTLTYRILSPESEPFVYSETIQASSGKLSRTHVSAHPLDVRCTSPEHFPFEKSIAPGAVYDLGRVFLEPYLVVEGYVRDSYGSPVSDAMIVVSGDLKGQRVTSDAEGHYRFSVPPGANVHVEVVHWLYGAWHGDVDVKSDVRSDFVLREALDAACIRSLQSSGFSFDHELNSYQIDDIPLKWQNKKIARGDYFESCTIRNGEWVEFVAVHEGRRVKVH